MAQYPRMAMAIERSAKGVTRRALWGDSPPHVSRSSPTGTRYPQSQFGGVISDSMQLRIEVILPESKKCARYLYLGGRAHMETGAQGLIIL
jgi:hypothetical protein